jgi:hypothetical protein
MNTRLLPILSVAFLLFACGGQQPVPQSPAPAAAATGATAQPGSAEAQPPAPVAVAMGRVRSMMDAVDDAKIKEAFSPAFLASIPPAKLTQLFAEVNKRFGACSGQQQLEVKGNTEAHFRLTCEHGQLDAKLLVDASTPYMIQGLLLQPAQD